MKYTCLGYYDPAKHAAMTEDERNAMIDECFACDEHLRANGLSLARETIQSSEPR